MKYEELLERDRIGPEIAYGRFREQLFHEVNRDRVETSAAGFTTRKFFTVNQQNIQVQFCQRNGCSGTGRSGSDDNDVAVGGRVCDDTKLALISASDDRSERTVRANVV